MIGDRRDGVFEVIRAMATQERLKQFAEQIEEIRAKVAAKRPPVDREELAAIAREKIEQGRPVTREEAAAFRRLSTRQLQRLEDSGELRRCPGSDHPVFYAARDVLRLASADGKEA